MTDSDGQDSQTRPRRRRSFDVSGDEIDVREDLEGDDGVFEVRMPIATTGEVRNDGDDPLTRDELSGMARQIDSRDVPVFLDHGQSELGGSYSRYSAMEKVGEWAEADVGERDGGESDQLVATARMMDPETLPAATGDLREALAAIKEQVERGFSLSSSIGWRDDGEYPGGVDLMEASIVGIGADPRTTSDASAGVVARAAVDAGADPDRLVARVRAAVDSERPLGPPDDPDRFDTFEECVTALQEDEDLSREEAERICGSWETDTEQNDAMTDDTDPDEGTDHDDEPDESRDAPEWAERMLELQEQTAETLSDVADAIREDDEDDDEDEPEDENETDEDDDEEDDDDEQSSEPDDQQALADEVESLRQELDEIRDGGLSGEDVDTPDPDDEQDATDDSGGEDNLAKYNIR